ncbi:MAG: tryptophan 7-halogenase [Ideonella sp.]|nr:tryptophan 7-halogenase [Ideonella sp.]
MAQCGQENYVHSFGTTGTDHWTAGFQHFWHKGRERNLAGDYGDYCLELKRRPGRAGSPTCPSSEAQTPLNYAFHLDATRYARFLRSFSEGFGVKRRGGKDRRDVRWRPPLRPHQRPAIGRWLTPGGRPVH